MAERLSYRVIFADTAVESFVGLNRRKQRKILDRAHELAADPFLVPDFCSQDAEGREIAHVMTDGYLFDLWVDHPAKQVVVLAIEEID